MVKGLSRGLFAAVNFYSGKLYQGHLQLHVNVFTTVDFRFHTIIFLGNTWSNSEPTGFSVSTETVAIQDKN